MAAYEFHDDHIRIFWDCLQPRDVEALDAEVLAPPANRPLVSHDQPIP
jgi:hypothetical protein